MRLILALIFIMCSSTCYPAIIFQDNFDNHNDWSVPYQSISKTWPTAVPSDFPSANPTTGPRMIGYAGQLSVITGQTNPRIEITSSAGRGGGGKGIRMRCEAKYGANNEHSVWYSDTQTYYTLTSTPGDYGYDEIWIQFYRRYSTDFYSRPGGIKYMHVSHFRGTALNDWHYDNESDVDHAPFMLVQSVIHDDTPLCCEGSYDYDDLTQDFEPWIMSMFREDPYDNRTDYGPSSILEGLFDHESTGSVYVDPNITGGWQDNGNFGDGGWHYHEIHLKMNSAPGVADGEYGYWIDGVVQIRVNDVPWITEDGTMVGWNMVSPGGNQDFHTLVEGGETFYYDMDDFVVSTTRLSDETPAYDATIVEILTESQSTTAATITIIGTLTTDSALTGSGVDVNGVTATADDGTWDEAVEAWTALGVELSIGSNTITATGTDSEAETDTDTVSITRTAPVKTSKINGSAVLKGAVVHQ